MKTKVKCCFDFRKEPYLLFELEIVKVRVRCVACVHFETTVLMWWDLCGRGMGDCCGVGCN